MTTKSNRLTGKSLIVRRLVQAALLLLAGVALYVIKVLGTLIYVEAHDTKNMRHIKKVIKRAENVEAFTLTRIHEDVGWAQLWLKSGEYIWLDASRESKIGEKWYVVQFGHHKCEEGRFEIFSLAEELLGRPVKGWDDLIHNASEVTEGFNNNLGRTISECTPRITYDRPEPPAKSPTNSL